MKELHTKRFHLFDDGHLHVYDCWLARRLNKHYRRYLDDGKANGLYFVRPDDETKFIVSDADYKYILNNFLKRGKSIQKRRSMSEVGA